MSSEPIPARLFALLSTLLDYPVPKPVPAAEECTALLASRDKAAAARLNEFTVFARATDPGRLEEVYTGLFELNAACYPHLGYQLFGETYKRSVFMLELKSRYRAHGFDEGAELPDYLPVMLRFLAQCPDETLREELIREGLLPALAKMKGNDSSDGEQDDTSSEQSAGRTAYKQLLEALRSVLETITGPGNLPPNEITSPQPAESIVRGV